MGLQRLFPEYLQRCLLCGGVFVLAAFFPACQSAVRFSSHTSSVSSSIAESSKQRANSSSGVLRSQKNTVRHAPLPILARSEREQRIVGIAERWLGTPYRYGSTLKTGTDCSGFVMRVYEENGQKIPRSTQEQFARGLPIDNPEDFHAGDLLFFNTNGTGVSHVGLYTGGDTVIHASSSYGVVKQSFTNTYLSRAYIGARRVVQLQPKN
jgi:cell wall-associated NlpC family hydrolase